MSPAHIMIGKLCLGFCVLVTAYISTLVFEAGREVAKDQKRAAKVSIGFIKSLGVVLFCAATTAALFMLVY